MTIAVVARCHDNDNSALKQLPTSRGQTNDLVVGSRVDAMQRITRNSCLVVRWATTRETAITGDAAEADGVDHLDIRIGPRADHEEVAFGEPGLGRSGQHVAAGDDPAMWVPVKEVEIAKVVDRASKEGGNVDDLPITGEPSDRDHARVDEGAEVTLTCVAPVQ